jgi:hypothetical protein
VSKDQISAVYVNSVVHVAALHPLAVRLLRGRAISLGEHYGHGWAHGWAAVRP